MILDNETVNHLIRLGKSRKTFSKLASFNYCLDEIGNVPSERNSMPLLDAFECLIEAGLSLHPDKVHPGNLVGLEISCSLVKDAVVSLCRVEKMQMDFIDSPLKSFKKQVDDEIKDAIGAHGAAEKVLKKLASQEKRRDANGDRFDSKSALTMDAYVEMVESSPSPEFTKLLLSEAGPGCTQWFSPNGPLSALDGSMVASLTATKSVEVEVKVLYVREKLEFAMVEIVDYKNDYSRRMLCHHNSEVELRFDPEQIERDDLVLCQYLKGTVPLRATALCATFPKASKKTVLTLDKLLLSRTALNNLHSVVHQKDLPFEDDTDGSH